MLYFLKKIPWYCQNGWYFLTKAITSPPLKATKSSMETAIFQNVQNFKISPRSSFFKDIDNVVCNNTGKS